VEDLILLSGGLKEAASVRRIEISRRSGTQIPVGRY